LIPGVPLSPPVAPPSVTVPLSAPALPEVPESSVDPDPPEVDPDVVPDVPDVVPEFPDGAPAVDPEGALPDVDPERAVPDVDPERELPAVDPETPVIEPELPDVKPPLPEAPPEPLPEPDPAVDPEFEPQAMSAIVVRISARFMMKSPYFREVPAVSTADAFDTDLSSPKSVNAQFATLSEINLQVYLPSRADLAAAVTRHAG